MATAIPDGLGLLKAIIFAPTGSLSEPSGDGSSLTGPLADLADELTGLTGFDEVDISDLAEFLQQAGHQAPEGEGVSDSPQGTFEPSLSDLFADPGPLASNTPWDGLRISSDELEGLLSALQDLSEDLLGPTAGPRTRRIDRLFDLERRESRLERLIGYIDFLETSGEKLVKRAEKLEQAGEHLENGVTPSVLRNRADEILELADDRATAREERAEELREEAEELRTLGGRENRLRARFKIAVARFLERAAEAIRTKGDEKAEKLGGDADILEHVMDKLDLSEDRPLQELRRAGWRLQRRAERMKSFGEFRLDRAERLKELLDHILERIRDQIDDLYGSTSSILDMEA